MALYGIDISKWQSVGTGDQAQDFVICKATEGVGYVDSNCDKHYQRAKANGKLLGVYHFARPDRNTGTDGAKREAQFFVNNCKGYIKEAILVLDWEQSGTTGQVGWAKAWLDEVFNLTGVRPLIYMSASVVNSNNWARVASNYGLWIAGYPNAYNVKNPATPSVANMPYKIGAWQFWAIWQYSSSAGTLDRDIANMDANGWRKYAGATANTTTAQNTPSETTTAPTTNETPKDDNSTTTGEKPATEPENAPESENRGELEKPSGEVDITGSDAGESEPEQPESTEKGLTAEDWDKIIEKASKTVELAQTTATKFGLTINMSNKVYDILKIIVAVVLPVISALYVGLANIWGFGFGEQVDKTIQLIIAAINALLGITIVKSSADYKK